MTDQEKQDLICEAISKKESIAFDYDIYRLVVNPHLLAFTQWNILMLHCEIISASPDDLPKDVEFDLFEFSKIMNTELTHQSAPFRRWARIRHPFFREPICCVS